MRAGIANSELRAADGAREASGFARTALSVITVALLAAIASLWFAALWLSFRHPLNFDDSFMFYRYALNMRHGLGMSWNRDGVHTYGETALLWGWVIWLLSYLPLSAEHALRLGSWACGVLSMLSIAWAVSANANSVYMRSIWRVLPLVVFPLMAMPIFMHNVVTGMETMLAETLAAIFVGLTLGVAGGGTSPIWPGMVGVLLFMTRPEMAVIVVILPLILLSGKNWEGKTSTRQLAMLMAIFISGVLLEILCCKLYFTNSLPLSFYMKSRHAYEGYRATWKPIESLFATLQAWPYLLMIAILTRRSDLRLVLSCLTATLVAFTYLSTVTQIMGRNSRYYVPYIALIVIPALLVLDRRVPEGWQQLRSRLSGKSLLFHGIAVGALIGITGFALLVPGKSLQTLDRRLEGSRFVYDPVELRTIAVNPLPAGYKAPYDSFSDWLAAPLPPGTTIAASEVGYLGYKAPQVNVIDLAGLNDEQIALHGFSVEQLLARKPDLIWLPHSDYTYQRGLMLSNPDLLRDYDVYANAAIYGVAVRKASPIRDFIDMNLQQYWARFYPGAKMDADLVKSATWSGQKHLSMAMPENSTGPDSSVGR